MKIDLLSSSSSTIYQPIIHIVVTVEMRSFIINALCVVGIVYGAIDSDKVTSLPGYAGGNLPSTHYSGCKIALVRLYAYMTY